MVFEGRLLIINIIDLLLLFDVVDLFLPALLQGCLFLYLLGVCLIFIVASVQDILLND